MTFCPLSMQEEMQNNVEVVHTYRQHIINDMNPGNLHLFINAYNRYRMLSNHTIAACLAPFVGLACTWGRRRGIIKLTEDSALSKIDDQRCLGNPDALGSFECFARS